MDTFSLSPTTTLNQGYPLDNQMRTNSIASIILLTYFLANRLMTTMLSTAMQHTTAFQITLLKFHIHCHKTSSAVGLVVATFGAIVYVALMDKIGTVRVFL